MTGDGYGTVINGQGPPGGEYGRESDVLLRQLDGHLAGLRASQRPVDLGLAELLAAALRRLVTETAFASAADRARVRAAVHYFVLHHDTRPSSHRARPAGSWTRSDERTRPSERSRPSERIWPGEGTRSGEPTRSGQPVARTLLDDVRVVNEILRTLGRTDLTIGPTGDPPANRAPGRAA